jgi:hypothetical protein
MLEADVLKIQVNTVTYCKTTPYKLDTPRIGQSPDLLREAAAKALRRAAR